jgi:hypothetical protein
LVWFGIQLPILSTIFRTLKCKSFETTAAAEQIYYYKPIEVKNKCSAAKPAQQVGYYLFHTQPSAAFFNTTGNFPVIIFSPPPKFRLFGNVNHTENNDDIILGKEKD